MVISLLILAILLVLGCVLLSGRGAWLIAGYNTMSPEEKAKYNEKALCRAMGWMMLALAGAWGLVTAAMLLNLTWLLWVGNLLFVAVIIVGAVYLNRSDRVKR